LVHKMLGIVGYQIKSKQIFNVVGIITNFWRSRLGIDNFDHLVLVIKNWLNNAYVGCDGGKAKILHDYLQAEQIMIKEHNKTIGKKKFEKDYEFNWFWVGKNFHKCFLFILCWFI
jgi:hypothetical protein